MDRGTHKNSDPCERAALSCARDIEHLKELRQSVPRLKRHLIGAAKLESRHGKIKQTGRQGHYSLWLRAKYLTVGHTLFEVRP